MNIEVKESNLELTFADTGCGIEDENKEKIFQRFYQSSKNPANSGGSGIGLHIASEYIKMHHGKISVKDNHPCGSIFLITFPLHQNSEVIEEDDTIKMQSAEEESRQSTILLVDDNYDFLKFLSESLSKQYHILKASNGKQALSILKKEDADLIISDVMMPVMDGLEMVKHNY